ncbi:Hypothetical predicted protein [Cloeon dipterum]|uniref:Uncharacterized protein n=1 Tax=Cloeon dipterum TaxID=197152 RepID=A0A8S1D298_9INSE|nr:Hypothetical predicted protein [Cloeon dipterum]
MPSLILASKLAGLRNSQLETVCNQCDTRVQRNAYVAEVQGASCTGGDRTASGTQLVRQIALDKTLA